MTLQEQIAEFEAKGCVAGGRKWEIVNKIVGYSAKKYDYLIITKLGKKEVTAHLYSDGRYWIIDYNGETLKHGANFKLESALIEALEIVKAKVMDLAKELGFVCFDKEQMTSLRHIFNNAINHRELQYYELTKEFNKLQQYIAEQGNEI